MGVFVVAFTLSLNARSVIKQNLEGAFEDVANTSANLFDSHVREWWEFAGGIAKSKDLRDPNIDYVEKAKLLELATEQDEDGLVYMFIDPNLRLWSSDGTSVDFSLDRWAQESDGGRKPIFADPMISVVDGKLIIIVAYPIHDFDDNFIGCLQIIMNAEFFSKDSLPDVELTGDGWDTGDLFIINSEGTHVANRKTELVNAQFNVFEQAKKAPRLVDSARILKEALEKTETSSGSYELDGKKILTGYSRMETTNWLVVVTADEAEYYSEVLKFRIQAWIFGLVTCILGCLIVALVARSIVRPLNRTVDALQNIAEGEGDLTVRLPVRGNDELTQMAAYFNKTMEKIRQSIKKVGDSTGGMQELGGSLSSNMTETASAVNQISSNIEGVKQQVINQSASVTETSATMEEIIRTIEQLNSSIETQAA
ncbi:MAG: methyl-accepting chemotaxis protein, partial [Treponemataceae bacterium]